MAKIIKDDIDRFHDYDIYPPTRTIHLGSVHVETDGSESGVDASMAARAIKNLHILDQKDEPITIILNNFGGDYYHGMAVHNAIKACKSHVTIKVYGSAMSMAAVILQAADTRIVAPDAKVMIHYGDMSMSASSKAFQKWAKEAERTDKTMEDILLGKIKQKLPLYKLETLQQLLTNDTILDASETINLGLADEIL